MPPDNRIVAVALLTGSDVELLGQTFTRLWSIERTPCFGGLLAAIDEADREYWRQQDAASGAREIILRPKF